MPKPIWPASDDPGHQAHHAALQKSLYKLAANHLVWSLHRVELSKDGQAMTTR
jgi:hypothetical protein